MNHLSSFFIYMFITAVTPGPNNIMSMSNAVRFGFKKSFRFNLGILAGFLIVMPLCTVFSTVLFSVLPKIKIVMLFIGSAYMLYLAWKIFTANTDFEAKSADSASFFAGMFLQFVNPKIYIYAFTSVSVYILPYYNTLPALIGFSLLLAFTGFICTIFWALFGSAFCKMLVKYAKVVNTILALLLVYCAVSLYL